MVHPGFTGRLHLGLESYPADFERAVDHLRRQGIEVTIRPQQPGYMVHAPERRRVSSSIPTRT